MIEKITELFDCEIRRDIPTLLDSRSAPVRKMEIEEIQRITLRDRVGNLVKCGDYIYIYTNVDRLFRINGILQSAKCVLIWNRTRYYSHEITKAKVEI